MNTKLEAAIEQLALAIGENVEIHPVLDAGRVLLLTVTIPKRISREELRNIQITGQMMREKYPALPPMIVLQDGLNIKVVRCPDDAVEGG